MLFQSLRLLKRAIIGIGRALRVPARISFRELWLRGVSLSMALILIHSIPSLMLFSLMLSFLSAISSVGSHSGKIIIYIIYPYVIMLDMVPCIFFLIAPFRRPWTWLDHLFLLFYTERFVWILFILDIRSCSIICNLELILSRLLTVYVWRFVLLLLGW